MPAARRISAPILALGLLLVVLAILAADLTVGLSPAVCGVCHGQEADGLAETAHADSGCLSCHLEAGAWSVPGFKIQQWIRMYPAQLTGGRRSPARDVSRTACLSCHAEAAQPGVVERSGLRISHIACAAPPAKCASCHGVSSHGEAVRWGGQPDMESCVACHRSERAPVACDTCHEGRLQTERLRRGVWRITHGPEWQSTHAMGSYSACATCHGSGFCIKCHNVPVPHPASFGSGHGSFAKLEDSRCDGCHSSASFCNDCHGISMPHPAGFLEGHKDVAESREDPLCYSCHEIKGCGNCHTRHDAHPRGEDMLLFRGGR